MLKCFWCGSDMEFGEYSTEKYLQYNCRYDDFDVIGIKQCLCCVESFSRKIENNWSETLKELAYRFGGKL